MAAGGVSQRPLTNRDLDTCVEILTERVDVVANAISNTNRLAFSIERRVESSDKSLFVIMLLLVGIFLMNLIAIAFLFLSFSTIPNSSGNLGAGGMSQADMERSFREAMDLIEKAQSNQGRK